mmetsp:Transcript_29962/g.26527  ORF Transcript_29962/g.26527 Transcript_29962/m.26527 type:complete len:101 (+) Transcript_29962:101-403(+)
MKEAGEKMNFDRIQVYPFKEYDKALKTLEIPNKQNSKIFESFSFKKGDLIKAKKQLSTIKPRLVSNRSHSVQQSISPRTNFTSFGFYPKNKQIDTGNMTF